MRTFFCIELNDEMKSKLSQIITTFMGKSEARVNWVDKENLHITMKFLGDVLKSDVKVLKQKSEKVIATISPFMMTLNRIGVFPNFKRMRVIWVGATDEPEEIHVLNQALEEELEEIGFEPEGRKYIPHITLGRVKERNQSKVEPLVEAVESYKIEEPIKTKAEGLTLMESKLTPKGPIYTPVFRHGFKEPKN